VGGGIELAKPAADITMLDIFNAMGEPTSLSLCTQGRVCSRSVLCTIHSGVWRELDDLIEQHLEKATLGDAVSAATCDPEELVAAL